jgi:RNA polymerase sigma-70 factor, ECF subfamily
VIGVETSLTWLDRIVTRPDSLDWLRLVDVYGPLLDSWLARAGVCPTDRDDLIQEVLIVVVRRVKDFEHRGPGAFRSWLRGILANHLRNFSRERRLVSALDPDQLAKEDTELAKLWDRDHDQHLAARAMRSIESDFAPQTWQAFRRQVLDGLPPGEVAAELCMSLNSVILAKSRVLKRLRSELQGLIE